MAFLEKKVVVGPFQCNCRILVCPTTRVAAMIDPGDEPAKILSALKSAEAELGGPIRVKYLLHTHAHLDHIGGTREVKESLVGAAVNSIAEAPLITLHPDDKFIYDMLPQQGQMFGLHYAPPSPVDLEIVHEQTLSVGTLQLTVIHTPGHSPGGVCFRLHESSSAGTKESVYSGDTLFAGSVGRTDLWGADQALMFKSIKSRLLTLDGDTRVCPGHGPDSTVGIEKNQNPFLI